MKVRIAITNENGQTFEGSADLIPVGGVGRSKAKPKPEVKKKPAAKPENMSFAINVRAFMKKHGNGRNGQTKFALLVARMAGGKVGTEVSYAELSQAWNKMKSLLRGELRGIYALRAKEAGWVDVPKQGAYVLTDSWREALEA